MEQFATINVKIVTMFILVKRVKLLEIEWKKKNIIRNKSDSDMKLLQ